MRKFLHRKIVSYSAAGLKAQADIRRARRRYEVETLFIYGWENVWTEGGKRLTFDSPAAARLALDEYRRDRLAAKMDWQPSNYRVRPV